MLHLHDCHSVLMHLLKESPKEDIQCLELWQHFCSERTHCKQLHSTINMQHFNISREVTRVIEDVVDLALWNQKYFKS